MKINSFSFCFKTGFLHAGALQLALFINIEYSNYHCTNLYAYFKKLSETTIHYDILKITFFIGHSFSNVDSFLLNISVRSLPPLQFCINSVFYAPCCQTSLYINTIQSARMLCKDLTIMPESANVTLNRMNCQTVSRNPCNF